MVKLVSVELYIGIFHSKDGKSRFIQMPDFPRFIPKEFPNGNWKFPRNSQTPFHALSFISVPTFVTCVSKMTSRGCVNSSESFCYLYGEFVVKKQQRNITDFVEKVYFAYFGVKIGDQDKSWAPHGVCLECVEGLRIWSKGKVKPFRFDVSMIWREPQNHSDDCYFCLCNVQGYIAKNKKQIRYPKHGFGTPPSPSQTWHS